MCKNTVETNIIVGTHADSLIAEAVVKLKDIWGFDGHVDLAITSGAVWKDHRPLMRLYRRMSLEDREENVDYEVRAGLTSVYESHGWVADDVHSETLECVEDFGLWL
ncbi:hypothetical protein BJ165DRAFT_1406930 [Panaeolus papilionaceus]|nr:hypothetical protein BJ165DRAFT_1406930 [Panaeolus papilionaceus]